MRFKLVIALFFGIVGSLPIGYAQAKARVEISKNFKFQNGVYHTYADWQRNRPTLLWDSLETNLAVNPISLLMQVEYIRRKKTQQLVPLDSIWGVVVDGIPYIRLARGEVPKSATCFAGLILRGRISYFSYETILRLQVPITAYIPQTGQAYATKKVSKEETVLRERLLNYETGELYDMSLTNVKRLITNDKELLTTVNDLKPNEVKEKLFKCLLIYNDRNPVFIK
jgi:hypothetical protein